MFRIRTDPDPAPDAADGVPSVCVPSETYLRTLLIVCLLDTYSGI
jgi:hypothetical protein